MYVTLPCSTKRHNLATAVVNTLHIQNVPILVHFNQPMLKISAILYHAVQLNLLSLYC